MQRRICTSLDTARRYINTYLRNLRPAFLVVTTTSSPFAPVCTTSFIRHYPFAANSTMGAGELPFSETPTPVGPGSASQSSHDQVSAKPTAASRDWLAYFQSEISISHADIPIILCCLVSGLCDSSAYNAWTCFVSMQTGEFFRQRLPLNNLARCRENLIFHNLKKNTANT